MSAMNGTAPPPGIRQAVRTIREIQSESRNVALEVVNALRPVDAPDRPSGSVTADPETVQGLLSELDQETRDLRNLLSEILSAL